MLRICNLYFPRTHPPSRRGRYFHLLLTWIPSESSIIHLKLAGCNATHQGPNHSESPANAMWQPSILMMVSAFPVVAALTVQSLHGYSSACSPVLPARRVQRSIYLRVARPHTHTHKTRRARCEHCEVRARGVAWAPPWDVGAGRVGPACVPKNYKKNARETADPRHHDPAHWEHLVVRVAILAAPSPHALHQSPIGNRGAVMPRWRGRGARGAWDSSGWAASQYVAGHA